MIKLKLSDVRIKLPFKIQRGVSELSIRDLAIYEDANITIDFDVYLPTKKKDLQRGYVWTSFQKNEFILSILKGMSIDAVSAIKYRPTPVQRTTAYKIIDGKQRLSTVISFVKNEFPLTFGDVTCYFYQLDEAAQLEILNMDLRWNIAYEYDYDMISDDSKIAWFEQINFAGTPQDIEHLNNLKS